MNVASVRAQRYGKNGGTHRKEHGQKYAQTAVKVLKGQKGKRAKGTAKSADDF